MKNLKTEAEKWADKVLEKYPTLAQEMNNLIELMMFGRLGYRVDKYGNKTKLTQQELLDLNSNPDTTASTFNSLEEYSEYLKSAQKE
jgi:hypothetical protein|nr:MAG TPA: hypothetical protein [Caudoviricetes sp.]